VKLLEIGEDRWPGDLAGSYRVWVETTITPIADVPWADVQQVFGTRGDPSRCWCQWFKMSNAEWQNSGREVCEPLLRSQPDTGLLAYLDGEPVGWVAVEPRTHYPVLLRSKVVKPSTEPTDASDVWSITCFVVRVGYRKQGVSKALVHAAVAHATAGGARVIEGYPVDPAEKKVSSADVYHGSLSIFEAAGFEVVARPSAGRALVRLQVA
jgi:GNAT superfamily N-acetyltransferase